MGYDLLQKPKWHGNGGFLQAASTRDGGAEDELKRSVRGRQGCALRGDATLQNPATGKA